MSKHKKCFVSAPGWLVVRVLQVRTLEYASHQMMVSWWNKKNRDPRKGDFPFLGSRISSKQFCSWCPRRDAISKAFVLPKRGKGLSFLESRILFKKCVSHQTMMVLWSKRPLHVLIARGCRKGCAYCVSVECLWRGALGNVRVLTFSRCSATTSRRTCHSFLRLGVLFLDLYLLYSMWRNRSRETPRRLAPPLVWLYHMKLLPGSLSARPELLPVFGGMILYLAKFREHSLDL